MLLNKVNVLDKGFISLVTASGNGRLLQDIQDEYFKTKVNLNLLKMASATFIIKCPIFVQLNLHKYNLDIIITPCDDVEAYIPTVDLIDGDSLEDREGVQRYIQQTTEALLLNQQAIPLDGGSNFTSQLLIPISVYNKIIVHGNLKQWLDFIKQKNLPKEMEIYRSQIEGLLEIEWKNIKQLMKM